MVLFSTAREAIEYCWFYGQPCCVKIHTTVLRNIVPESMILAWEFQPDRWPQFSLV